MAIWTGQVNASQQAIADENIRRLSALPGQAAANANFQSGGQQFAASRAVTPAQYQRQAGQSLNDYEQSLGRFSAQQPGQASYFRGLAGMMGTENEGDYSSFDAGAGYTPPGGWKGGAASNSMPEPSLMGLASGRAPNAASSIPHTGVNTFAQGQQPGATTVQMPMRYTGGQFPSSGVMAGPTPQEFTRPGGAAPGIPELGGPGTDLNPTPLGVRTTSDLSAPGNDPEVRRILDLITGGGGMSDHNRYGGA